MRQSVPVRLLAFSRTVNSRRARPYACTPRIIRSVATSPPHLLAQVRSERDEFPELWFSSSLPYLSCEPGHISVQEAQNNERTLKLGKSEGSHTTLQPAKSRFTNREAYLYF